MSLIPGATRADLENELQSRLRVASNSSVFTSARLTELIQNAYMWATETFPWLELGTAKMTNSIAGKENYDYPSTFRTMTIYRLEVNGETYFPKRFDHYLTYKKNFPNNTSEKIFATHGRQYFIFPTPTANTDDAICIWGLVPASTLSASTSKTIFSDNKPLGNEAVVRKAYADAIRAKKPNDAKSEEENAVAILAPISKKEWDGMQLQQSLDTPMFEVPDYFTGYFTQFSNNIGNFYNR